MSRVNPVRLAGKAAVAKDLRLYLTLLLSAAAAAATLIGGSAQFKVVAIGAFVIFAPGLVLVHLLRIGDALLSLVIMMMTGPSLWVAISTVAVFSGLWSPETTIVVAAAVLAVVCVALIVTGYDTEPSESLAQTRHRFVAEMTEDALLTRSGRHRSAFPSPYEK